MSFPRRLALALAAAAAASALVAACGDSGTKPGASSTSAATPPATSATPTAAGGGPFCADPASVPATLNLRDKLAQLLMVGVENADDAKAVATNHHIGGIMIGSWTDLEMLKNGALTEITNIPGPLPLAVSVDEEGGRVSRLKTLIGTSPSPRVLANTLSVDEVRALAHERGEAMRKLGITIDFAPVVDVTEDPDDTVIGDRSFGSTAEKVTAYAGAYAQGLREAGVLPVLKHFPGHGHGSGDSHKGGVTTPPLGELVAVDLVPYKTLLTQGPVAVMIGHMQVPGLTGSDPASLSRPAIDLLRTGTGYGGPPFDGTVFSDDVSSMAAISDRFGVTDAVLRTLQAGSDIALWVSTKEVPAVLDRLEQAVNAGELPVEAVDRSVVRVATMKRNDAACPH
ncbi:glycoside hydrolase family 3 N-terminal domain-containing protein [Mycobacterium bourgelatii]|uniref:glycoside hydrolase family 3 N-terminal domain-containing protein n=1 Tax=Mycobacterium bourgelatii TaxID=1273442 RepID=UPI0013CF7365|nr:glycoside hydrolase family 3 N-terminal domain-containing protein [Mycobacterium bourgelatii]MCV6976712.1 glycoside hydrolase family 3 protein [Mycobacterium bourgelatii]